MCRICGRRIVVLLHPICSLYLIFIAQPDWPTYALLHVLHFNLCILLGLLYTCLSESCCCIVLTARKATFRFVCLNRLITRLISGLKCVNAIHFLCNIILFSCCWFCFCFLVITLVLRLRIISVECPFFSAVVNIVFHSSCFDFSVAGNIIYLFM